MLDGNRQEAGQGSIQCQSYPALTAHEVARVVED